MSILNQYFEKQGWHISNGSLGSSGILKEWPFAYNWLGVIYWRGSGRQSVVQSSAPPSRSQFQCFGFSVLLDCHCSNSKGRPWPNSCCEGAEKRTLSLNFPNFSSWVVYATSRLLFIVSVVCVKIVAWQESKHCDCSSAGPLKIHDYSVAVDSSVAVTLADSATLHTVYFFLNGCLVKPKTKAFLVLSVELKQTVFIAAQEINNKKSK